MKKLLLILLCLPLFYSCGDKDKTKKLEDRIAELEIEIKNKNEEQAEVNLSKEVLNSFFEVNNGIGISTDNLYYRNFQTYVKILIIIIIDAFLLDLN